MRLSEAIREGSKQREQAFGSLYGDRDGEKQACALGAAIIASVQADRETWRETFTQLPCACPEGCSETAVLDWHEAQQSCWERPQFVCHWNVISHLNDGHRWTREAIADWIQLQEAIHGIGQDTEGGPAVEARELIEA